MNNNEPTLAKLLLQPLGWSILFLPFTIMYYAVLLFVLVMVGIIVGIIWLVNMPDRRRQTLAAVQGKSPTQVRRAGRRPRQAALTEQQARAHGGEALAAWQQQYDADLRRALARQHLDGRS